MEKNRSLAAPEDRATPGWLNSPSSKMFSTMQTILADLNPAENISQIAERPSMGASAT